MRAARASLRADAPSWRPSRGMGTGVLVAFAAILAVSCSGAGDLDLGTIVFANVVSKVTNHCSRRDATVPDTSQFGARLFVRRSTQLFTQFQVQYSYYATSLSAALP